MNAAAQGGVQSIRRSSHIIRNSLRNSTVALGRVIGGAASHHASRELRTGNNSDPDLARDSDANEDSSSSSGVDLDDLSMSSTSTHSDPLMSASNYTHSQRRQQSSSPSPTTRKDRGGNALSSSMVQLNKSGHKAVQWSKYLIMGVLLVIATVIIAMTYVMLEREDQEDFERGFENLSLEMFNRVIVKMGHLQTAFQTVANDGVSVYASLNSLEWPFVTVPNWQLRALTNWEWTHAVTLGFAPLVSLQNLNEWETYAMEHAPKWLKEALPYQAQLYNLLHMGHEQPLTIYQEAPYAATSTDYVYHLDDTTGTKIPVSSLSNNSTTTTIPVWQLAPAPLHNASIVNFDLLNHTVVAHAIEQLLQTKQQVLSAAFPSINMLWKGSLPYHTITAEDVQKQQPFSLFFSPILEHSNQHNSSIVAILYAAVPWNTYMERTVANQDLRGLHVVMDWIPAKPCAGLTTAPPTDNEIHPTFTYRVDGNVATFVGYGDLHEEKYDDMVVTMDFVVPVQRKPNLTCAYGHYQWLVYPTKELQDTNYSPSNVKAWLYAIAVVVIFCIATLIFLSYDYLVQLRQKAVLDTAMRSNAIVTNLFPSNVRDRIMKEAEEQAEAEYRQKKLERKQRRKRNNRKNNKSSSLKESNTNSPPLAANNNNNNMPFGPVAKNQLKDFLNDDQSRKHHGSMQDDDDEDEDDYDEDEGDDQYDDEYDASSVGIGGSFPRKNEGFGGKPIADLFPAATVLFADIVGFTAWSSVREPAQVFQLLETLYHHFDEMANRRRVFKVETIGDCYVAVTGLPDPRPDHAIVMARFARDILLKMKDLCQRLEVILGPDTGELALRIGLHSGAVTAGVLRGEKSRFQLFGDTVNTAARMESNGAANRIHMSAETAKLLQAAGKKWTKKRADLVEAKGKGKMQTYWLATGRSKDQRLSRSAQNANENAGNRPRWNIDSTPQSVMKSLRNLNLMTAGQTNRRSQLNLMKSMSSKKNGSLNMSNITPPSSRRNSLNVINGSGNEDNIRRDSSATGMERRGSMHSTKKDKGVTENCKKTARLVRWNAEVLSRLLKQVVARRNAKNELGRGGKSNKVGFAGSTRTGLSKDPVGDGSTDETTKPDDSSFSDHSDGEFGSEIKRTVLEEVKEIIHLPNFDAEAARNQEDPYNVQLDPQVKEQLLEFVTEVASMYRYNPFHSFEHASHVTMSVVKLLSRIVAPDAVVESQGAEVASGEELVKNLHDHTYGITSDPLTQFAVVLSALIHDLDHPGVPNATLVKEGTSLAALYKNKSVAEQNSVDLAWEVLMGDRYKELRSAICATKAEKKRFRQLIVNVVMATDIVDKELKELRNARWDKAFKGDFTEEDPDTDRNRKATIVIEHLIQASDIAHTMQHWHIYRKWNERFFEEQYNAYVEGRAEKDPSDFWYKGEIGFFDFYIIPLAKKLKECGVFGVSSDEYLSYAEKNRAEWEIKGQDVVKQYIAKYGRARKVDADSSGKTAAEEVKDISDISGMDMGAASSSLEKAPALEKAPSTG